jgi:hypothetical protein
VTKGDLKWIKGYLRFTVELYVIEGLPAPRRANHWLDCLRGFLVELEAYLTQTNRQAMRAVWDEIGMSPAQQSAFWTRRRADAARLRRVLRDPALPRLLARWEQRKLFTDRQGG